MVFWKILFGLDVLATAAWVAAIWHGQERLDRWDFVALPVCLVGVAGLGLYAFEWPSGPSMVWRVILPVFIACAAKEIANAVNDKHLRLMTAVSATPAVAIAGFTSVALYRLAGQGW
jgi:hypothetical protein